MSRAPSVDYVGYVARPAGAARPAWRRAAGRAWRFVKLDLVHNTLLYPYGAWRHARLRRTSPRSQAHTYTCFVRSPLQLEAFAGPVVDRLLARPRAPGPLRILVLACSNGAEAYTLAAALMRARPELDFTIEASDLHEEMAVKAREGRYSRDEVLHGPHLTPGFLESMFEADGEGFRVRAPLRARVRFGVSDLLDPGLPARLGTADLVLAQNVLFHLPPAAQRQAMHGLMQLLAPGAALAIEGMDPDVKVETTRAGALEPLAWRHREIYEQSRSHVPAAWWRFYYGSEPYGPWRRDRVRRYASIFFRA